ncbi:MAG TPA: hypothetical protein VK745_06000 [Polyangiaceae bacterium]|jgi:hypothetical protein|nr:hypothetical protein [Polyangiaceae bacterium]
MTVKQTSLSSLLLLAGCIGHGQVRGEPLYPIDTSGPLPLDRVASLSGAIESVDGQPVQTGHRFELLPGCHTVKNASRWGGAGWVNAMNGRMPVRSFAMNMRAGYYYYIRIEEGARSGSGGAPLLVAEEQAPNGKPSRQFDSGQPCDAN